MIYSKTFFFISVSFLSFQLYSAQNKQRLQIDRLIKDSESLVVKNDLKALELSKKAIYIAESMQDSKRKALSYLSLSNCLFNLCLYKESLLYVEKGLKEQAAKEDVLLSAKLNETKASNYFSLELLHQSIEENKKINTLLLNNNSLEALKIRARCYGMLASIYLYSSDYNDAKHYINLALQTSSNIQRRNASVNMSDFYTIKGHIYLEQNKRDSSLIYFKKSLKEVNKRKGSSKYIQLRSLGDYYYSSNEYKKSLDYYLEMLKDIGYYRISDDDYISNTTKRISELYGKLNDKKNETLYFNKHLKEIQKIESKRKEDIQVASKLILEEKTSEKENIKTKWGWIMAGIIIFFLCIIFLYNTWVFSLRRKKEVLGKKSEQELQVKEEIIDNQKKITSLLEKKINQSFQEIVELAKSNNSEFFARFKEVYPEVIEAILEQNNKLRISELTLCAYIFLGFNTKDIAAIINRSISTVSNRKYNLRKKLNIPTEENLEIWFQKKQK